MPTPMRLSALLIEDDPEDVRIMRRYTSALTAYDLTIDDASCPDEACERAARHEYDVVFLDCCLGLSSNAPALLQRLRQISPQVPVIVVTGAGDQHLTVEMMKAGASDYLVKDSLGVQVLERSIRHAIERRDADAARAHAQEKLRRSEERYRTTLDSLGDALHVVGPDLRVVLANKAFNAWAAELGLSTDLVGQPLPELFPFLHNGVAEEYRRVFREGRVLVTQEEQEVASRNILTETRKIPVWTDGEVTSVITVVRDITEARAQAERLRESERRYRELVQNASSIIMRRDTEGRVTFFNEFAQRFFGYGEDEILGKSVIGTIVPPTDSTGRDMAEMIRNITRDPGHYAVNENENMRRDGERVWVAWTNTGIRGADGKVKEILSVGNDITERRMAELELERERTFSNTIIDTAGALIVVLDSECRIVRFNKACQQVTGYSSRQVLGRPFGDLLLPDDERERVMEWFRALLTDTEYSAAENHWVTKSGGKRLMQWRNSRVLDPDGRVKWVIGTGIDVTERRALEQRLHRAGRLEAVGQLAGGVAHDFNNLLTAILGYVDLNIDRIDPETQLYRDMGQIKTAASRAADLTRQLLAFGRQHEPITQTIDLNASVRGLESMLQRLIEEHVELKIVLSDASLFISADQTQITQVLINLVVNARDAMPDGGVLTVQTTDVQLDSEYSRIHPQLHAGRYAMVSVTDTGLGMSRDVQERMFDPFFTTKDVGQGTGLGLSTVYGIVQQHAGSIECSSQLGEGTTFKVYLPLVDLEEESTSDIEEYSSVAPGGETVLVVEDETEVRNLVVQTLQVRGYAVLSAADGAEALRVIRSHEDSIDLLLTDVVMPRMDGPELAQRVRMLRPHIRLLFMSGYPAAGPHGLPGVILVQKPFTPKTLARKVREALNTAVT